MNFVFDIPSTVIFGNKKLLEIGEMLQNMKSSKTMIVCDKTMVELGFIKMITDILEGKDIQYSTFDGVMPNPTDILIEEGAVFASREEIDSIIAIGGGSVMDAAKAINILYTNKGNICDYEGVNLVTMPVVPLIAIPTTSGTASEVTSVSVITDSINHKKMVIAGQFVGPSIALCDPSLTINLPKSITAATGMDALTHSIEAYISKWSSPITDTLALESIKTINDNLEGAVNSSNDTNRNNMMLGSILAGMAFNSALLGLVHSLAHPLSAHYDTAHGVANAIFLPYVIEYNMDAIKDKRAPLAKALGISTETISETILGEKIVERLHQLSNNINIPTLKSLNIPKNAFEMLAQDAIKEMSTMTNPKDSSVEDLVNILSKAYSK